MYEKNQKIRDLETLVSLTRILKNGLYAILEIIYIFWIGATFSCSGWLAGLLAVLCVAAIHPLRWLWDDSANVDITADTDSQVKDFKKKLEYFFAGASILCDIALIVLVCFTLPKVGWIVGIAASAIITNVIHVKIRSVNGDMIKLRENIRNEQARLDEETKKPATIPVLVGDTEINFEA